MSTGGTSFLSFYIRRENKICHELFIFGAAIFVLAVEAAHRRIVVVVVVVVAVSILRLHHGLERE